MDDIQFWRITTVSERIGLSKSEIYRRVALGEFPKPRRYPGDRSRLKFWLASEIVDWQLATLQLSDEG